ncbi:hypothetical protein FQZ97_600230 [compost metagenome]
MKDLGSAGVTVGILDAHLEVQFGIQRVALGGDEADVRDLQHIVIGCRGAEAGPVRNVRRTAVAHCRVEVDGAGGSDAFDAGEYLRAVDLPVLAGRIEVVVLDDDGAVVVVQDDAVGSQSRAVGNHDVAAAHRQRARGLGPASADQLEHHHQVFTVDPVELQEHPGGAGARLYPQGALGIGGVEVQVQHLTLAQGVARHAIGRIGHADPGGRLGEEFAVGKGRDVAGTGHEVVVFGAASRLGSAGVLDEEVVIQFHHRDLRLGVVRHCAVHLVAGNAQRGAGLEDGETLDRLVQRDAIGAIDLVEQQGAADLLQGAWVGGIGRVPETDIEGRAGGGLGHPGHRL